MWLEYMEYRWTMDMLHINTTHVLEDPPPPPPPYGTLVFSTYLHLYYNIYCLLKSNLSFKLTFLKKHPPLYYKHICEGGGGVKIDYFRPRSAECDGIR